jgi:hypothetical protein
MNARQALYRDMLLLHSCQVEEQSCQVIVRGRLARRIPFLFTAKQDQAHKGACMLDSLP